MKQNSRIVILQPAYIPWLGFFEQFDMADIFVFLDHVQYNRRSWHNRNYILNSNEQKQLLTVPLRNAPRQTAIKDMRIFNDKDWRKKHLSSIRFSYIKAPYFEEIFDLMETTFSKKHQFLGDLTIELILNLTKYLGYTAKIALSSELNCKEKKENLMVEIASIFNADTLLTGASGRDLYNPAFFKKHNITIEYQAYQHPQYLQQSRGFIPYLSIIDLLFNVGSSGREILRTTDCYNNSEIK
jgi:hypothetical protein